MIDGVCSVFCCVFSWNQKGCCAGFSQEHWVCLSSSPSYWFLFSVFTWAESMAFFYWSSTLSFSSLPCSLNLELSNSDTSRNTNWTSAKIFRRSKKYIRNVLEYIYFCKCMFLKIMSNYCALDKLFSNISWIMRLKIYFIKWDTCKYAVVCFSFEFNEFIPSTICELIVLLRRMMHEFD